MPNKDSLRSVIKMTFLVHMERMVAKQLSITSYCYKQTSERQAIKQEMTLLRLIRNSRGPPALWHLLKDSWNQSCWYLPRSLPNQLIYSHYTTSCIALCLCFVKQMLVSCYVICSNGCYDLLIDIWNKEKVSVSDSDFSFSFMICFNIAMCQKDEVQWTTDAPGTLAHEGTTAVHKLIKLEKRYDGPKWHILWLGTYHTFKQLGDRYVTFWEGGILEKCVTLKKCWVYSVQRNTFLKCVTLNKMGVKKLGVHCTPRVLKRHTFLKCVMLNKMGVKKRGVHCTPRVGIWILPWKWWFDLPLLILLCNMIEKLEQFVKNADHRNFAS